MTCQPVTAMTMTTEVHAALDDFDRAFASGDADALAELFAVDASLLLLYGDAIEGREAIRGQWTRLFAAYDPGEWRAERRIVDVHGDRAYALSVYSERLVHRENGSARIVHGRLIHFLRRDPDGTWRVSVAMNSHTRPVQDLGSDGAPRDA